MSWGTGIEVFGRVDQILAALFSCVVCKGARGGGYHKLPSDSGPWRVLLRWNVWVSEMDLIRRIDAPRRLGYSASTRPPQSHHTALLFPEHY